MPDEPPPFDPKEILGEVQQWRQRTRFQWRHRGLAYVFWLWGLVWLVGYGGLYLWGVGAPTGWLWMGLWALGLAGTAFIYERYGWRVRPMHGETLRYLFWPLTCLFIGAAFVIRPPQSPYQDGTRLVLYILWAYALLGLQERRVFYISWALITALLIVAGFVLFGEQQFYLWMAIVGSGAWFLGGVYQRRWEH